MIPLKTFQNISKTKQERITRAAVHEFSEKGYKGASINVIVNNLGIAKGSMFQYFGDKKGLFLFVFQQSMEMVKNFLRTVRDSTVDEDIFTRLEKTLLAGFFFIKKHPVIYKLYLNILFDSKIPLRNEILLSLRQYSLEYLNELLITARDKGELRKDMDLKAAGFILDAVMDRFLQVQTVPHLDAGLNLYRADEKNARKWINNLVNIMRMGIGKPTNHLKTKIFDT